MLVHFISSSRVSITAQASGMPLLLLKNWPDYYKKQELSKRVVVVPITLEAQDRGSIFNSTAQASNINTAPCLVCSKE